MKISRNSYVYLPSWFVFFFALAGLLSGFLDLNYEPWDQIVYYSNLDLSEPSIGMATHFSRFAVVFPAYFVSQAANADLGYIFTFYILGVVFLVSLSWASLSICMTQNLFLASITSCIPYLLLPIINGRFAFALCGISLAHCSIYLPFLAKRPFLSISIRIISLLLASVSSGTFMVAACILASSNLYGFSTRICRSMRRMSFPLVNRFIFPSMRFPCKAKFSTYKALISSIKFFSFLLAAALSALYLYKNLSYFYAGNIITTLYEMLSHGLGFVFNARKTLDECGALGSPQSLINSCSLAYQIESSPLIFLAVATVATCFIFWQCILIANSRRLDSAFKITIFSSVFFGLFGLTTLMSLISIVPLAFPMLSLRKSSCRNP